MSTLYVGVCVVLFPARAAAAVKNKARQVDLIEY